MNTSSSLSDEFELIDSRTGPSQYSERDSRVSYEAHEPRYELGLWIQAVRSYFDARNHPLQDAEQSSILTRDWSNELVIARHTILRLSQLSLRLLHLEGASSSAGRASDVIEPVDGALDAVHRSSTGKAGLSLVTFAEVMGDLAALCEALLKAPEVGFFAWSAVGKILLREIERSEIAGTLERAEYQNAAATLPDVIFDKAPDSNLATEDVGNVTAVVAHLTRLLHRLRFIESCLKRDRPLKQTLPIFCLIYAESRATMEFVDSRVLSLGETERPIFDALDGLNYAMAMELRKVFSKELVGIASMQESPSIYAMVENAHGLLRDCFQQSVVGVAQLVDTTIDVSRLFDTFQTRLEQSLTLRKDLWTLLQTVKRAEQERDGFPISRLLEKLNAFREGSLRYLMYKDWEACERFMEEVAAARGVLEMTPVVHRFCAYLEMLFAR